MRALLLTLTLTACTPYVGLAVHPAHVDAPEHYAPNPIGIVGAEYERGCGVKRSIQSGD